MFATNGGGWGPSLSDGQPLFHSSRGNVGSGTVGTAGIGAGRLLMRALKDASGTLIAPTPTVMLVGPAGETAAEHALSELALATAEGDRPIFSRRIALAVEPRLAGSPWFLFADPDNVPVIGLVHLSGTGGNPQLTQHELPSYDGIIWKLVHDFCVAPVSPFGAVRLTGA